MKMLLKALAAMALLYVGQAFAAVNLNEAGPVELESLTGIGPAKAAAIIQYREANDGFASVDELTQVPGIGDKTLESLRNEVTVEASSDDATAEEPAADESDEAMSNSSSG